MKYVSSAGWYSMSYPDDWIVEEDKEKEPYVTTFYDPEKGVGVLQVSAYDIPIKPDFNLVSQFIESLSDIGVSANREEIYVNIFKDKGVVYYDSVLDSNHYFRYWMINRQNRLLFITYNCAPEDKGKEDKVVEEVIETIQLIL